MRRHECAGEICFVCGAETERERRLLDVGTAARMCRVSRPTIYRWMRARQIEWVALPTGRRRVYLDSLFKDPPVPRDALL
jgi:hypothetical protein